MALQNNPATPAVFIDAPRDSNLQLLHLYWSAKRGPRRMPARADINPSEIRAQLPYVMLWTVDGDEGAFTIRLVGEHVVRFVGENNTGRPATHGMPPDAAESMRNVLGQVARLAEPRFRIGKAFWKPDKSFCDYEACFLPLSADGETVNMIFGGARFDFRAL
ncbi:MAG: PAS domain-containing protein [Rhizomicrobium sp.]